MTAKTKQNPLITRDNIVEEAISLLEATSLSGVMMRVLADRLGIKAASLYWHFPNKAALEAAISERLFLRALELVPESTTWQDWMRGLGRAIWDNLIDCPDSGLLIMSADLSDEQFQRADMAVRQRLARFEIDQEQAYRLHSGIQALITGWVTFAHSPSNVRLGRIMDIREAAMETLDAMIDGWAARLAQ